jgi:hypothetical protein
VKTDLIACSKQGYTSITCSKIEKIPYNFIFATKFNDSSILISVISWDYLISSFANEYVGDVEKYHMCGTILQYNNK